MNHWGICPECKQRVVKFGSSQLIQHFVSEGVLCPGTRAVLWTLDEGLQYIRERQTEAFIHHYNLSLGGGILDRGFSDHDLDIIATPANGLTATMDNYLDFVLWMNKANITKVSEGGWNQLMRKHEYRDERSRKIDWFVVGPINVRPKV